MRIHGGRITMGLALAIVVASLLAYAFPEIGPYLVFDVATANRMPWTCLSYPLITGIVAALFGGLALATFGNTVETDVGRTKIALYYIVVSVLGALGCWIGSAVVGRDAVLIGPWVIVASVVVTYGTRYPRNQISIWGLFSVEARWLAWIAVGLTLFAARPIPIGAFTCVSLAFAWAFATNRLSFFPYGQPLESIRQRRAAQTGRGVKVKEGYLDDVKRREKEREEKERLRKLFEGSISEKDRKD